MGLQVGNNVGDCVGAGTTAGLTSVTSVIEAVEANPRPNVAVSSSVVCAITPLAVASRAAPCKEVALSIVTRKFAVVSICRRRREPSPNKVTVSVHVGQ